MQDNLAENTLELAAFSEKTLSIIDLIFNGGAGSVFIMGLLFVLLAVALYIYFERWFAIRSALKIDDNFKKLDLLLLNTI